MEYGRSAWLGKLPHAVSFARVVLTALTYVPAALGDRPLFAVLVLLCVMTDILDGPLARALGTANRFGANVDSAADLLFYVSLPAWTYLFAPDIVRHNLPLIATLTILYVSANLVSHWTFGALGVHNRLSRASGTVGVAFTFYTIMWGIAPLLRDLVLVVLVADLAQRYGAVAGAAMRKRGRFA